MTYLFDEICEQKWKAHSEVGRRDLLSFAKLVATAEKVVIDDVTASAASTVSGSSSGQILTAIGLCRWPYRLMWVEWNMAALGRGRESGLRESPDRTGVPAARITDRVGVLVETGPDHQRGRASFIWKTNGIRPCPCLVSMSFDFREVGNDLHVKVGELIRQKGKDPNEYYKLNSIEGMRSSVTHPLPRGEDPRDTLDLAKRFWFEATPHFSETLAEAATILSSAKMKQLLDISLSDLTGEGKLLMALLMLMNSKSAEFVAGEDRHQINRRRRAIGRVPLQAYTVFRITPSRANQRFAANAEMTEAEIRQHLVRGHFKIRRSGIYWWSPFIRGSRPALDRKAYITKSQAPND